MKGADECDGNHPPGVATSRHGRLMAIKPSSDFSLARFCVFAAWRDEHSGSEHVWFPLKLHRGQNVRAEDAASLERLVWTTYASSMVSHGFALTKREQNPAQIISSSCLSAETTLKLLVEKCL